MATQTEHAILHTTAGQVDRLRAILARAKSRAELGLVFRVARYGLRRDLDVPFEAPEAKIPIALRPMREADLDTILATDPCTGSERRELELQVARRKVFLRRHPNGFVAVDERNGTPCYTQWLIGPSENGRLRRDRGVRMLAGDEAMLENAFTPPGYRGQRIMPAAMALIAVKARDIGARYVMTYVEQNNIPSLKGCQRSGFAPHLLHVQTRVGFGLLTHDRFSELADDDARRSLTF